MYNSLSAKISPASFGTWSFNTVFAVSPIRGHQFSVPFFYSEGLLAPAKSKARRPHLAGSLRLFIRYKPICSCRPYLEAVSIIRNLRTRRTMVRRALLSSGMWGRVVVYWYRHFGGTCCWLGDTIGSVLAPALAMPTLYDQQFDSFSPAPYSSTLRIDAPRYFETLVHIYQTTRRHIPQDNNLYLYTRINGWPNTFRM
jgi:hypothetical protein